MKKKTFLIFSALVFSMFFVGSTAMAVPYSLMFDADALGTNKANQQIFGWDMEMTNEGVVAGNAVGIVTHQSLGADDILNDNDTFNESFTLEMLNGYDINGDAIGGGGYYNFPPDAELFIDLTLQGYITNHSDGGTPTVATDINTLLDDTYDSVFTSGVATMYVDSPILNKDYDVGETLVATLSFYNAAPMIIVPSVFQGVASAVSMGLQFDSINMAYFGTAPGEVDVEDLVGKNWLLTFTQTSIAGDGQVGDTTTDPDQFILGWDGTGMDARFEAIPEPATMFLLGSGLLGLVGFGRKRIFKKD